MGWLKGRQVFTATAVFNLAGLVEDRPNYLKTTVVGAILNGADSIGSTITNAFMNGPAARTKAFHRWAINNYSAIGVPGLVKLRLKTTLPDYIRDEIGRPPLSEISVLGIQMGGASFSFWAEQWLLANNPSVINTGWTAEFLEATGQIKISLAAPSTVIYTFTPVGFDQTKNYIYASYSLKLRNGNITTSNLFIYQIGSGKPTLDALYEEESQPSEAFLAPIPVRLDGAFLSDTNRPTTYALANKACKKAFGSPLSDVVDQISESPSIEDMDYVYLVYGASANSKVNSVRRYIFDFLEEIAINEANSEAEYQAWKSANIAADVARDDWYNSIVSGSGGPNGPRLPWEPAPYVEDGQEQPDPPPPPPEGGPSRPYRGIKIENPGGATNYDVRFLWSSMEMTSGSGAGKPGAVPGDVWFSLVATDTVQQNAYLPNVPTDADEVKLVWLYHQVSPTFWKAVKIRGMAQHTYVFGNNKEEIFLADEIGEFPDDPTRESSFLFPVKYSVFAAMSAKQATEFAINCGYLQVHAYDIYIQAIYETPLFSLLLVAIVISITAASGGFGAASSGILGTNAAVGATIGLTGVAAVVAGAVTNAIAAIIVTKVITAGAKELLGEKAGAVIGALASVVAINGLSNLASGGSFVINFTHMSMAEKILAATSSVSKAVTGYMGAELKEIRADSEELTEEYNTSMKEIADLYAANIGYDRGIIDPLQFLDSAQEFVEAPQEFIDRTLKTGSDIAELTMLMLSNFADITLDLNNVR